MGALYRIKAHPASRENRSEIRGPQAYEIWVRAKPENGKANAAILDLLAHQLGVPVKRLRIVKGATSASKIVALLGD